MNDDIKRIAPTFHTLLCKCKHARELTPEREPELCYWYVEEQLENYWEELDHGLWLERTRHIYSLGFSEFEPFKLFVDKMIRIVGELSFMSPSLKSLALMLLNESLKE